MYGFGPGSPKVAIVEFSDFECPFCERFTREVAPILKADFVASGKLRYFFANNPLPVHGSAMLLATGAICAGAEQFWEMHDRIFSEKPREVGKLIEIAGSMALDADNFQKCVAGVGASERVKVETETAQRLGLHATPAFVIGKVKGQRLAIQKVIIGAQSLDAFEKTIQEIIATVGD